MGTISKEEVDRALVIMEEFLFGRNSEDNPNQLVPLRLCWVFAAAYAKDYRPPESIVLLESYKLLQEKGYYYEEE